MMKHIAVFVLVSVIGYGQTVPRLQFNHLYYILEPEDLTAIIESGWVNDTLCARETRADSTATYLFGPSDYLELFGSGGNDSMTGFAGIAFSVDRIGDLEKLKDVIYTTSTPPVRTQQREIDGTKVPWFDALAVVADSGFHENSRIFLWLMEYRTEYFTQKGYAIRDSQLTREHYLERLAPQRANKILKRFTGVVLNLERSEKHYLTGLLRKVGYRTSGEDIFIAPDDFRFILRDRKPGDRKAIESIEFESSAPRAGRMTQRISEHVTVEIAGTEGRLVFK